MTPIRTNHIKVAVESPPENARRPFLSEIPDTNSEDWLLVLDNTSLYPIKQCHKQAYNYLIAGRQAISKESALTFGGALHDGLEIFHKWYAHGRQEETKEQMILASEAAISKYYKLAPVDINEYRTEANCLEVFRAYRKQCNPLLHPGYEMEILFDEHGPIVERAFEFPLTVLEGDWNFNYKGTSIHARRIHVAWSGRIDLIARINQLTRICDNKTSSIDTDQFRQSFQFSSQTLGYAWAAQKLWPDLDVRGFMLNAIYFRDPKGKPIQQVGPRGGAGPLRFERNYYNYSDIRISRWERDTILLIEDFLHSFARGHFPLNDSSCFGKYSRCQYYDCCAFDNEAVGDNYLQSAAFKDVTWNPTTA